MIGITVTEISNLEDIANAWANGLVNVPDQTRAEVAVNANHIICAEARKAGQAGNELISFTKLSLTDGLVVCCVEDWPEIRALIIEEARCVG